MLNYTRLIIGLGFGLVASQAVAQKVSDDDEKFVCATFTLGHIELIENFSEKQMDGVDKLYATLHEYRCSPDGRTPVYNLYDRVGPARFADTILPRLEDMDRESKLTLLNTPASDFQPWTFGENHTLLDRLESDALLFINSNDHDTARSFLNLREELVTHGAKTWAELNNKTSSVTTRLENKLATVPGSTRNASGHRLAISNIKVEILQ